MPYVGEIRLFGGTFAPLGWAMCDGSTLPISEYETLFNLIGTTYGGDGQTTFNVPDLRGRVPLHQGSNLGQSFVMGQMAGTESVTLTQNQMPAHTHQMFGSTDPSTSNNVQNNLGASLPAAGTASAYGQDNPIRTIDPSNITPDGGNQPHENLAPILAVSVIISLFGNYPSPT